MTAGVPLAKMQVLQGWVLSILEDVGRKKLLLA